jgi:ABC-type transporter Mla maintaining outer membrane lipid asymmetry ATPase subunit MlaF
LGGEIIFEGKSQDVKNTNDKRLLQFIQGASGGPIKEMEV